MTQHPLDRDLETARMVQNWLQRTAEELPDSPTGRERLLEQVERSSQRSGRWLPPVAPAGLGGLHTAAKLAAAAGIAVLLVGLFVMTLLPRDAAVLGPASESASPLPSPTEPPLSASVTGTITGGRSLGEEVSHWEGDIYHRTEPEVVREIEWSDPRLPSEMRHWIVWEEYVIDPATPSQRGGVKHGRVSLTDELGSWVGVVEGVFPRDRRWETEWFTLTGSGAYEGLYAVLIAEYWYDTDTFEFEHEITGLIAEADPPPARPIPLVTATP